MHKDNPSWISQYLTFAEWRNWKNWYQLSHDKGDQAECCIERTRLMRSEVWKHKRSFMKHFIKLMKWRKIVINLNYEVRILSVYSVEFIILYLYFVLVCLVSKRQDMWLHVLFGCVYCICSWMQFVSFA